MKIFCLKLSSKFVLEKLGQKLDKFLNLQIFHESRQQLFLNDYTKFCAKTRTNSQTLNNILFDFCFVTNNSINHANIFV